MSLLLCAAVAAALDPSITVTASREPVPLALSGTAISVIDAATIEALKLPLVADYLRLTPSASVAVTGPLGAQTQVRIRGAEANQTLVFIDGIKVNDPAASGEFRFESLLAGGLDRIEVLRGPQSALWGTEAIGGVVNIVTRQPRAGSEAYGEAEGGSFGGFRTGAGGGYGTDAGGVSGSATYVRSDGIDIAGGGGDRDGYDNLSLSGKGVWTPAPNLEFGLAARFASARSEFDDFDFDIGASVDAPQSSRVRAAAVRGYGQLALLNDRWTHRIAATFNDTANVNRTDGELINRTDGERFDIGYQTSATATTGAVDHRLTFAAEYDRQRFVSRDIDPTALSNQRRSRRQTSVIGEYRLTLSETFAAGVAVRHDDNNRFRDTTTARATAALALDSGLRLHASYGEGVTDPSFTEQFGFFPDFFIGNPDLRPERAIGWDAGIGWSRPGIVVDLTWFDTRLEDEIIGTFDFDTFLSSVDNATGESDRRGVEATLDATPADWLRLKASYAFVDADEQRVRAGAALREVRRPRHSGSVTAAVTRDRFSLAASIAYVGKRLDTDFASFSRVTLGDYALVTLSGSFALTPEIELTARVENAADARYRDVVGFRTQGVGAFGGVRVKL